MSIQVISPETEVAKTTEVSPDQTVVSNPSVSKKVSAQVASTQAPVKATAAAALAKKDQEEEARQAQIAEAAGEASEAVAEEQVAESGETVEATQTIATVAEEIDASSETLAGVVADAPMMFAQAGAAAAGGAAAGGISTAAIVAGVAVVGVAAAASSDSSSTPAATPAPAAGTPAPSPEATPSPTPAPAPVAISVTGTTLALTSGADTPTLTDKNDLITGSINTLSSLDSIVDSSTTDQDQLRVDLNSDVDAATTITNIEFIKPDVLSGSRTINATKITGVTTYEHVGSGALVITNVGSATTGYKMTGTASDLTVTPTAAALTGAGDNVNLEVNGTTAGTFTLSGAAETLTINSSGTGTDTLTNVVSASTANLVIQGTGTFKTTGNMAANFTLVDARTASKVDIDLVSGANQTVLTGTGDDTVELNSALATGNLIDLGGGNDTLVLVVSTGNAAATLRGVENIQVNDATGAATQIDLANANSAVNIDVKVGATDLDVSNMKAGSTIKASEALAIAASGTATIGFASSATATSLNLDLQKGGTHGGTTGGYAFVNVQDLTLTTSGAGTDLFALALDETASSTVVTKSLTVVNTATGTGAVTVGAITAGDDVETVVLTNNGTGALSTGTYIDIEKLQSLTINANSGTVTTAAYGGTTASTAFSSLVVNAGKDVQLGSIGVANLSDVSAITVAATGGIVSADGTVDGALTGGTITNTGGNIKTVTISGSKDVELGVVTATAGKVETVTSTNTGAVYLTITNADGASGTTAGSVISMASASGKVNQVTLSSNMADTVTGGAGNDTFILVKDGNDSIDGSTGTDTLSFAGNANGQIISIDTAPNYLNSKTAADAAAADIVVGGRAYDNNSGSVGTTAHTIVISNVENITGSDAADLVYGNSGSNVLVGGAGADTIYGGEGDDTISGADGGADVLYGQGGADTISLTNNTTGATVVGGDGNDTINLGTSTAAKDTVVLTGTGTITSGTANFDTIAEFFISGTSASGATEDVLAFGSTWLGGGFGSGGVASLASGGSVAAANDGNIVFLSASTGQAGTAFDNVSEVSAYFNADMSATTLEAIFVAGSDNAYVWFYDGGLDGSAAISVNDFVLLGVLNGVNSGLLNAANFGAAIA